MVAQVTVRAWASHISDPQRRSSDSAVLGQPNADPERPTEVNVYLVCVALMVLTLVLGIVLLFH